MIKEDILKQEYTEIADLAIRMENNVKEAITLYNEKNTLSTMFPFLFVNSTFV